MHSYSVPTSNIDELHLITIVTRITLSYVLFSLLLISHNLCSTIVFYITIKVRSRFTLGPTLSAARRVTLRSHRDARALSPSERASNKLCLNSAGNNCLVKGNWSSIKE